MKTSKALLTLVLLGGLCLPAIAAPAKRPPVRVDAGAATLLSGLIPGLGESYNSGWKHGFPWTECILSSVCCPLIRVTSMIDAASGVEKDNVRIDFWSLPD